MHSAARPLQLLRPTTSPLFSRLDRRRQRLGEVLTDSGYIDRHVLREVLKRKAQSKAQIGEVLLASGLISGKVLAETLAHQWNLGIVNLEDAPPDPWMLQEIDVRKCLRIGCIPWREVGGVAIIVVADPNMAREAVVAANLPHNRVAIAIADSADIRRILEALYSTHLEEAAVTACPADMSCRHWTGRQITRTVGSVLLAIFALTALFPVVMGWVLLGWVFVFNCLSSIVRFLGLWDWFGRDAKPVQNHKGLAKISDYRALPRVSLMVPLHREDLVLPALMGHIRALDYPAELLDVKLLVEHDDDVTQNAITAGRYDRHADIIVVPPGAVTTKPRALNYGINMCKGEIIGILDAEDRPDSGQIRAVIDHLHLAPPDVAAVQGELDFYNTSRNWMSRCFTIEYAIWFKVLLKGMRRLNLPIPLGGTTVYFRRKPLEDLGGWDAHNVTEDADLGMRIARAGMKTEMLPSVTWEEANSEIIPWIKQRSRWLKGYIVTWAVHMRNPVALYRDMGFAAFMSFQITLLGGVTAYLSMPFLWLLWIAPFGMGYSQILPAPDLLWKVIFATMIFGNLVMLTVAILAVVRTKRLYLLKVLVTIPIYWSIGAIATMKALAETLYAPFYWDKTTHGTQSDQTSPVKPSAIDLSFTP